MKAFWPITASITLTHGFILTCAPAAPSPRVADLAPIELSTRQVQRLRELQRVYNCSATLPAPDNRVLEPATLAAHLQQCLTQGNGRLLPEDLHLIERLQGEFATDQSELQTEVDTLDPQLTTLTDQQFSATTRLEGEVVMALLAAGGDGRADDPDTPIESDLSIGYRMRLNFITSFTGRDRLRFRIQARNIAELEDTTGTQMANLGFDGVSGTALELSRLEYDLPLTRRLQARFQIVGGGLGDFAPAITPLFGSSGNGAISTFGRENPIRRLGGGSGFGLAYDIADWANLSVAYVAPAADLVGERYGIISQLTLRPVDTTTLGLTYVRSLNNIGTGTGSERGEDPFDGQSDAIATNAFGAEVAWEALPQVTLSARLGYLWATAQDLEHQPTANLFTWAASVGLTDLGTEGSLTGLIVGTPPQILRNTFDDDEIDPNAAIHLEIFYRWPLNQHLALTPGLIMVINPASEGYPQGGVGFPCTAHQTLTDSLYPASANHSTNSSTPTKSNNASPNASNCSNDRASICTLTPLGNSPNRLVNSRITKLTASCCRPSSRPSSRPSFRPSSLISR
ncbi:iron uptake porin [Synechococcales cyanobacterium C]|uniref:Iron uptake porin n=1 Tax=Petrachloros mirabilis ULC683 TaxID=2781853 RepID=A0A8K1ZWN5_9CYAN|nr:iron uptake porin [Petrachloros mirabilis ULC683]